MPDDCYARIDGGVFGPMSSKKLREWANTGRISYDTPIRRGKNGKWVEAGRIKGLQDCFELDMDVLNASNSIPRPLPRQSNTVLSHVVTQQKQCPFCAEMIVGEARKCRHCGELLDPLLVRQSATRGVQVKNPGLAAVFSFFWTGLGQIYNGEIGKGIMMILLQIVNTIVGLWLCFGIVTIPLIWIWGIVDAYRVAESINHDAELQDW